MANRIWLAFSVLFFLFFSNTGSCLAGVGGPITEVQRLPNGLTVVLQQDHSSPVVAIQYWVHAGSRTERADCAGITHLIEHMIFKGTPTRKVGEVASEIESAGGEINAYTSYDYTVYHVTISSRFATVGLEVLTDAIQHALFDPVELSREKKVVLEELKMRLDKPWGKLQKAIWEKVFRSHPYGRPIIGYPRTVEAIKRKDITRYVKEMYVPSNIVLVIVGDVEGGSILEAVKGLWQGVHGRPSVSPVIPKEPPQRAFKAVVMKEKATEAHLQIAFRIPSASHPDSPVLDLLSMILGSGRSSRLFRRLRIELGIVHSIGAYSLTLQDEGLFLVYATCAPEDFSKVYKEIWREIFRLHVQPPDLKELQKAKTNTEADFLFDRETMKGRARTLGYFQTVFGSIDQQQAYLQAVRSTKEQDIQRVAKAYLRPSSATAGVLLPKGSKVSVSEKRLLSLIHQVEGQQIQTPSAERKDRRGTSVIEEVLPNGMKLLIRPQPGPGTLALKMVFLGGSRLESKANAGISRFLAGMLTKGTISRDEGQIAEQMDSLAGELEPYAGRNSTGVSAKFLSKFLPQAVEMMADVVMNPSFPPKALERQRRLTIAAIRRERDQPMTLAFRTLLSSLFSVHPYGLDPLGTEESVSHINRGALMDLHNRVFVPDNAVLAVVGDVDPGQVREWVYRYFGKWDARTFKPPQVPKEPPLAGSRTIRRPMPFKQDHVVIGFHGASLLDPDRYPLEVLNVILSGQGGRLFRVLRDKMGLAYTVTAFTGMGLDPGYFGVYIATSPKNVEAAIKGLKEQIRLVRRQQVSTDELQRAKRYIVGNYEIGLQSPSTRAFEMALNERYGLGHDFYKRYIERIQAVNREDLLRVAKKYLNLKRSVIVIVGPVP